MPNANPVFAALGTTIFTHMSALAVEHNAVNLGQGFPDEDGPVAIREAASRALLEGPNQYPPMRGASSCATRLRRMQSGSTVSISIPAPMSSSPLVRRRR